ncbi:hypothetical protein [Phytoactinopolyspora halotolerans]|uniref:Uncharacterized protein n=1 Tax=Phytoactinopolyspora halotolerans TaxID=1981512 RepID=A0A6L9SHE6_9ACTN|nr:hypothetical protein [Phytoactinopolyspora halotolerans]NEE04609.1 hypothetical protein [Phytoactinopolyspora halotolerans]
MQPIEGGEASSASPQATQGDDGEPIARRLELILSELDDAYTHLEGALAALRDLRSALTLLHRDVSSAVVGLAGDTTVDDDRDSAQRSTQGDQP